MTGTGLRHSFLLAIAPNANSSVLCGTSPSIEPWKANAYTHRSRAGSFRVRNAYLQEVLKSHGRDDDETWTSVTTNSGSVQHLGFLTEHEKAVYKTATELDQHWIIRHAAERQPDICQGQSVNLFFPAHADRAHLHRVHFEAWKRGLKGLYYLRTEAESRPDDVTKTNQVHKTTQAEADECTACHG